MTEGAPDSNKAEKRPVAVITDSATALPAEISSSLHLLVTPMEITFQGVTYDDGPDGVGDEFYDMLRSGDEVPKTSAPRPARWLENIRAGIEVADSVVIVTLASNLSASYDSARVAVEILQEEIPDYPITVVDSKTAAGSEALVAIAAARDASRGASHAEVLASTRRVVDKVRLFAYLDTLEYVWRSGRVPRIAVWANNILKMKPLMELSGGRVVNIARPRSRTKAMDRMLTEVARSAGALPTHFAVMHADAPDEASSLHDRIEREFNVADIYFTQFAPFMGAHTGPGLVGVSFWAEG
ncbi:MAG: DegV family protein [Chloroflexi bacterium]|nr:DegV family protein [Chloroflexota bacterium]